jgi:hypothetical protein
VEAAVAAWVVRIEAASGDELIEAEQVERLLDCLGDFALAALYQPDRYAVQLLLTADTPAQALVAAESHWSLAVELTGTPSWPVVRAEVETPEELAAACAASDLGDDLPEPWQVLGDDAAAAFDS